MTDRPQAFTALARVRQMLDDGVFKPEHESMIAYALQPNKHPIIRTRAFHEFYGAPIGRRQAIVDREFQHMDNDRIAFRCGFLISEVQELLEKGLGIKMGVVFYPADETDIAPETPIFDDKEMCREIGELLESSGKRDLVEVVDALADINVVNNGFAIELGVEMDPIDIEVAASNFTKPDENGEPIIGDGVTGPKGKVLKGPNFMEPQIAYVLGLR